MERYSVKSGDNLWNIVKKEFKLKNSDDIAQKVQEVAKKNNIKNPDSIFEGQKISLYTEEMPTLKATNDIAPLKVNPPKFDLTIDKSKFALAANKQNPQGMLPHREYIPVDDNVHGPNPGMDSFVPSASLEAEEADIKDEDVKIKRYSESNPSFFALNLNKYADSGKRIEEAVRESEKELKLSDKGEYLNMENIRKILDEFELGELMEPPVPKGSDVVVSSPKPVVKTDTEPEVKVRKVKGAEITSPVKVTKTKSKPKVKTKAKIRTTSLHNIDVTQKYTGTAEQINSHLGGVLKGMGATLLKLQDKYGISAAFLAAIAINESANGTSYSARKRNNVGGVRKAGSTKFKVYKHVEDCLEDMARFLKKNYIDQGRTTVGRVGAKYCPTSDHTDTKGLNQFWPRNVGTYMSQIDPSVKNQV